MDIYYIKPPKQLSTYPMYIDNPKKMEKTVGSYIGYNMDGKDITEQLTRRNSDLFVLYENFLRNNQVFVFIFLEYPKRK